MSASLIHGDHVSCSRIGGAMRRESSRLRQQARSLEDAIADLGAARGSPADAAIATVVATSLPALLATADDLDEAGAALQRYATDLAEGHELGRRAERRADSARLLLEGTRVVEPWGPASAREAELRRAQVPDVQSRVDLASAHVGRARGRLARELMRLTTRLAGHFPDSRPARRAPLPPLPPRGP